LSDKRSALGVLQEYANTVPRSRSVGGGLQTEGGSFTEAFRRYGRLSTGSEIAGAPNNFSFESFPHALRSYRLSFGLTQRELGVRIGVSHAHVAYLESGRRRASVAVLNRIATLMGVELDQLLSLVYPETDSTGQKSFRGSAPKERDGDLAGDEAMLFAGSRERRHEIRVQIELLKQNAKTVNQLARETLERLKQARKFLSEDTRLQMIKSSGGTISADRRGGVKLPGIAGIKCDLDS